VLVHAHHSKARCRVVAEGTCLQLCTVGSSMSPAAYTGGLGMSISHYLDLLYVKFQEPWNCLEFCRMVFIIGLL